MGLKAWTSDILHKKSESLNYCINEKSINEIRYKFPRSSAFVKLLLIILNYLVFNFLLKRCIHLIVVSGDSTFDDSGKQDSSQRCCLVSRRFFTDTQHITCGLLSLFSLFSALKLCLPRSTNYFLTLLNYPISTLMMVTNVR